jgi:hypothetical protein
MRAFQPWMIHAQTASNFKLLGWFTIVFYLVYLSSRKAETFQDSLNNSSICQIWTHSPLNTNNLFLFMIHGYDPGASSTIASFPGSIQHSCLHGVFKVRMGLEVSRTLPNSILH